MSTEQQSKPLVITELRIENVKRIRAVNITPDGKPAQVIGGKNAAGKTSTLDSIEMAIGGSKAIPQEPLRRGARKGKAAVSLGTVGEEPDFMVERTFSPDGTSQLVVKNREGVPQKSPQALLDSLCAAISFDPFAFTRLEPKKQDAILKEALNLDFTDLDNRRASAFAERTEKKRAVKDLDAQYAAMPEHPNAPAAEVSVSELAKELNVSRGTEGERRVAENRVSNAENLVARANATIQRLKTEMKAAEKALKTETDGLAEATATLAALPEIKDTSALEEQIQTAEETNAKIRANATRKAHLARLNDAEKRVKQLDEAIEKCDTEKQEILAGANFPIPGLGFDETGPTLNGVPLEQSSSAEQLRVSVAIGFALNPRLRVLLIREGSLLDEESMGILSEMAAEAGGQLWLEVVKGSPDGSCVYIEDGQVKGAAEAAE